MKNAIKTKKIISVIALCMALCMCLAGCGSPSSNNDTNTAPVQGNSSDNKVSAFEFTEEEVAKMANTSKTVLDLLVQLFPDNGVYEDGSAGFAFKTQDGITDAAKEVIGYANRSRTVIEFLEFLYPDRAIYRDDDDGYTLVPLREYLQKNQYDWSDVSSALRGIDVSKWQGNIDWNRVAASGVKFVFVRVGYRGYADGTIMKDEFFDANMQGAINSGIPVGVYFASKARNVNEAKEEAQWLLEQIAPYNITWPVAMDIEIQDETDRVSNLDIETRTENVLTALQMIKDAGYTPMIYSNPKVLIARLDYTKFEDYSKWVAEYQNQAHYPYAFQIWQASETGSVDGIEGEVDINYAIVDFGTSN